MITHKREIYHTSLLCSVVICYGVSVENLTVNWYQFAVCSGKVKVDLNEWLKWLGNAWHENKWRQIQWRNWISPWL